MVFGKDQNPKVESSKRWAAPRPAPTDNRVRMLPCDSEIELRFLDKAEKLGLITEGMNRNARRRLAKRLSDSDVALKIKRIHNTEPVALSGDDDLLLTHLQREAESWRARARRDRQIALAHELLADQAEAALAELVIRLGLADSAPTSIEDDFA